MILLRITLATIMLVIFPLCIGYVTTKITETKHYNRLSMGLFMFLIGNVVMWGFFQIFAVPLIVLRQNLITLVIIWMICLVTFFVMTLLILQKKKQKIQFYNEIEKTRNKTVLILLIIVSILIVGFQCYKYVFFMHLDEDDSRFIVCAVDAWSNGTMYLTNPATGEPLEKWAGELAKDISSPWSMYLATISTLIRIHPTIFAHTIYPVFLLVVGYIAFYLIGDFIFKGNKYKSIGMVIVAAICHMYYSETVYTQSRFTLVRIWQGKAVVAGVMIPTLLYLLMRTYELEENTKVYILLFIADAAMCLMSGIGIFFSGIMIGIYGVWYSVIKKRIKDVSFIIMACLPTIIYGITYIKIK